MTEKDILALTFWGFEVDVVETPKRIVAGRRKFIFDESGYLRRVVDSEMDVKAVVEKEAQEPRA